MDFDDGYGEPADEFDFRDVDFTKPILDGPTHHGFDEFFGVPGNTEDPLDTEPRIYLRNDRWTFSDHSKMKRIGMKHREGRILAAPDWDLAQLGPDFLREAMAFLKKQGKGQAPFFLITSPLRITSSKTQADLTPYPMPLPAPRSRGRANIPMGRRGRARRHGIGKRRRIRSFAQDLAETDDPRSPGHKLIDNTLVIFTSDNGPNVGTTPVQIRKAEGCVARKQRFGRAGTASPLSCIGREISKAVKSTATCFH